VPPRMPSLLLIRHGEASYGAADYDVLSERGSAQAVAVHHALTGRGLEPAWLLSGSLQRQLGTATPWDGEVRVDPRWNEYDADDILRHHSASDARLEGGDAPPASTDFQRVLDEGMLAWIAAGAGGGAAEPWPAFHDRVRGALHDATSALGKGETGVVFTSGGVIALVCVLVLGIGPELVPVLNRTSVNASVTRLISGRRGLSLLAFNEHGHLAPELVTFR
jgi:broad specificity phosphatase PhoE